MAPSSTTTAASARGGKARGTVRRGRVRAWPCVLQRVPDRPRLSHGTCLPRRGGHQDRSGWRWPWRWRTFCTSVLTRAGAHGTESSSSAHKCDAAGQGCVYYMRPRGGGTVPSGRLQAHRCDRVYILGVETNQVHMPT